MNCRGLNRIELERVTGIEPVTNAWEAAVIPFHHTRLNESEIGLRLSQVEGLLPAFTPVGQKPDRI